MERTPKPTPEAMLTYATVLYYQAVADPNKPDQPMLGEARALVQRGLQATIKPKEGFQQLLLTILQQQNDLAGSAEILESLLQQSPAKGKDLWQLLMATYLQLSEKSREKDPAASRALLVRAIVTCERAQGLGFLSTPKDNMNLVSLYLMANQFSQGTELLYDGMKFGKIENEPNNWRVLGRYHAEAGQNTRALAVLREAAQLFPQNGELEIQLAQLCLQMEKTREALAHAKSAVAKGNFEASTKPFNVHYLVAYTAYDLGEIAEAHRAIAEAEKYPEAAKDPQFPKLKAVIIEAVADLEAKARQKAEASSSSAPAPKRAASLR
jgi:tetratricopeptide (TPR) repeat protein